MIDWINLGTCVFTAGATVVAAIALLRSNNTQKKMELHQRKESTILSFQGLQKDVLDKMVSVADKEITDVMECLDEPKMKEIYDIYRSMIARCEHFAVGVEEGVYDFDTVDALAGKHLVFLYGKFKRIINEARRRGGDETYYIHFEQLANKLDKQHRT